MEAREPHEPVKYPGHFRQPGFPGGNPPWGIKDLLAALLFVFMVGLAVRLLGTRLFDRVPLLVPGSPGRESLLSLAAACGQALAFIGFGFYCVSIRYRAPLAAVGLGRFSLRQVLGTGIPGGLGIFLLMRGLMWLFSFGAHRTPPPQPPVELLLPILSGEDRYFTAVAFLLVGVLAPFGEELYFRGFLYPILRSRWGVLPGILATSVFFGALHCDPLRFILLSLAGAVLTLICEKTGSLFPSIVAHGTWNTAMLLLLMSGRPL